MQIRPFQWIRWFILVTLSLLLAWVAFYFYHIGFGRHWRAMLAREFQAFGLDIRVRRLTLDPVRGLVAKDLQIYDSGRRQMIIAQISDLSLDINYANLFQGEPALNSVDLHDAKISIPVDASGPKAARIRVTGLQARIYFFPGRIEVRQASGTFFGIRLQASGTLVNPGGFSLPNRLISGPQPGETEQQKFLRLLTSEIRKFRFSREQPELDFTFQVDLSAPASLRLQGGHLFAGTLARENYTLHNLDCRFSLENQKLELQKLSVLDGRGELVAVGTWNLANGEKNFQIRSGLDPEKLLADDSKFPWLKELAFDAPLEIEVSGTVRRDGQLQLLGKLNFDKFSFRNVKFQSMSAEFSKSGSSWMVINAQVTHRSGTLTGDVLNRPGDFRLRVNSALNPTELAPICPPKFQRALREWEFQTPPVVQATFSGASRDLSKVSGKGQVWFGKTIFRGTLLNSASAAFELRDDVIWCDQVRVTRDEGSGSGKFNCDLGTDRITIDDVEANLAPAAVAAWIDTRAARFLEPIRFTAAPSVRASGTVESGVANNLRIGIDAQAPFTVQLGGGEIPIKRGSAEFRISGVDPQFPAICGMIVADGAVVTGSKFLETLLNRLGPLGFREPLDINLGFKLARESFQLVSFQLTSGPHTARLAGSFYFPGGLVDLGGNIDFSSIALRGTGTIQDPTWQLIPGTRQ
jgi:hypothetical protein